MRKEKLNFGIEGISRPKAILGYKTLLSSKGVDPSSVERNAQDISRKSKNGFNRFLENISPSLPIKEISEPLLPAEGVIFEQANR